MVTPTGGGPSISPRRAPVADTPDNLITLADYARGTDVVGARTRRFRTCRDCPVRSECESAGYCQGGEDTTTPPVLLRAAEIPDIIA